MLRQGQNVRAAFPQWRQPNLNQVQAVTQVFLTAEALEHPLLQHAQEPRLRAGGKRRHFIEDDGAFGVQFEAPKLPLRRAGKCATFVPKKFALQKWRWQTFALDFYERSVAPGSKFVDQARKVIFSGAALSGDEDRGRNWSNALREFEETLRGRILADPGQSLACHNQWASPAASVTRRRRSNLVSAHSL